MDVVVFLVVMSMQPLALAAAVLPPVATAVRHRRLLPAGGLYLGTGTLLAAWFAALNADMDWAERTGGAGNALASAGWLVGAMMAAAGAIVVATRRTRTPPAA